MKKLILTSVALVASVTLYAQGTINFANNASSPISSILTGTNIPARSTGFAIALYYLPDQATAPTTADFVISLLPNTTFNTPGAGQFSGGTKTTPNTTPPGSPAWFQVRCWETAFGATWEEAISNPVPQNGRLALVGTSNIIRVTSGNPPLTTPGSLTLAGLQGFVLVPVPEPTTIGLGLLGLGALLVLRRRK